MSEDMMKKLGIRGDGSREMSQAALDSQRKTNMEEDLAEAETIEERLAIALAYDLTTVCSNHMAGLHTANLDYRDVMQIYGACLATAGAATLAPAHHPDLQRTLRMVYPQLATKTGTEIAAGILNGAFLTRMSEMVQAVLEGGATPVFLKEHGNHPTKPRTPNGR